MLKRVSAAELRAWAPFVRKDVVQACDVILSRGRGLESLLIAALTCGRYSHAAIFLPFRFKDELIPFRIDPPSEDHPVDFEKAIQKYGSLRIKGGVHLDLVEADDYGVGAAPPRTLTITLGGSRYHVVRLSGASPPKAVVLLRHPDIASLTESEIEQAVQTFSDAEMLRRYSSMEMLLSPLALPKPIQRILGRFLLWKYPQPKRLFLPGCFCSELVVKCFDRLGISPFTDVVAPENVSPNLIASSRSRLAPVPEAIITAADISDDAYGEISDVLQMDLRAGNPAGKSTQNGAKRSYLLSLVETREHKELLFPEMSRHIEDIAAVAKQVEDVIKRYRRSEEFIYGVGLASVQKQILDTLAEDLLPPILYRTLNRNLYMTLYLHFFWAHLHSKDLPSEAYSFLRLIHDRTMVELLNSHERTGALVKMSRARRLPDAANRQQRTSALAVWRSKKALWEEQKAILNRPVRKRSIEYGPSDAETQASVRKALTEIMSATKAAVGLK